MCEVRGIAGAFDCRFVWCADFLQVKVIEVDWVEESVFFDIVDT